ncbi:hypothetical protein M8J75_011954 [Diaphorina citri]|nr:hypothetical protein M8J75_011954 [Diaphorina citri]
MKKDDMVPRGNSITYRLGCVMITDLGSIITIKPRALGVFNEPFSSKRLCISFKYEPLQYMQREHFKTGVLVLIRMSGAEVRYTLLDDVLQGFCGDKIPIDQ